MATTIHPTAVIDPSVELGEGVEIGPYCVIHAGVTIGDDCWLQNHVTVAGPTTIGKGNRFFAFSSIGQQTQDLKYSAEPTYLRIGDNNTFREFVTVNRATSPGDATVIGSHGNFLTYSHIGHDCIVGDHVIFSNNGTLGGHVICGDYAIISGLTAVHQFCRIGEHAMIGGCTKIVQDVCPYFIVDGNPARTRAVNTVGLGRRGFSEEEVRSIKTAFKVIYKRGLNHQEAVAAMAEVADPGGYAARLADFVATSERGIVA